MSTFDPNTVPAFPVYTLALDERGRLTLDGFTIHVPVGDDPVQAGHRLVAERARSEGLDAVRVRAVAQGHTTTLVITANGDVHTIATAPPDDAGAPRRPRWAIGLIAGLGIAAVAACGFAVAAGAGAFTPPTPTASPSYTPPGAGARLPVYPPPGYSPDAAWSLTVRSGSEPVATSVSEAAVILEDGTISVRSLDDGKQTWRSLTGVSGTTVELARIAGTPVLVSAAGAALTAWDLSSEQGTSQVYSFPTGGTLSVDGSAPMMTLPNQTVGIVTTDGAVTVDIPATSTAVLARQASVIAANGEQWWEVAADNTLTSYPMPVPAGVDGQPRMIRGVDDNHIVVVWPASSGVTVALVNLQDNEIVAAANTRSSKIGTNADLLRSVDDTTVTLGDIYIDHGATPAVIPLEDITPTAVDGDTVYGTDSGTPVLATLANGGFIPEPFTTQESGDHEPVVSAAGPVVLIVADKLKDTNVYATKEIE